MAYLGKTPSQAVRSRYYFTASGGETSLSPSEVTGLSFTDANYVDVSLNGVALVSGTDYTATPSTNTISGLAALTASAVVEIVVYDTFSVFGGNVNGDFNISGGTLSAEAVTVTGLTTTGDINFGDNDKAVFGAGSDLEIFSTGADVNIRNGNATSEIRIQSDDRIVLTDRGFNEIFAVFNDDSDVKLYHNQFERLATTASGIDVTGNATFDDNGKAIFGAGNDLQILHDGSNSFINDTGTGILAIQGSTQIGLYEHGTFDSMVIAKGGAEVELYYDNAQKLETTSTGIDVTGAVTADGLTGDSLLPLSITAASGRAMNCNANGGTLAAKITSTGDISFYADDGTTQALFFDASTQRLGLGNTNPATTLDVTGTVTADGLTVDGAASATASLVAYAGTQDAEVQIVAARGNVSGPDSRLKFYTNNGTSLVQRVDIDDTGDISFYADDGTTQGLFWDASTQRLGLGTNSPASDLHVSGGSNSTIRNVSSDTAWFMSTNTTGMYFHNESNTPSIFTTNNTERMRIDSSGHILVGQNSVSTPGQGNQTAGGSFRSDGRVFLSANGVYSLGLNRDGDGELTNFSRQGVFKGSINISTSAVSYNTTSDHRLKQNVVDMTGAIDRVKALAPKRFNFIADPDDTTVDGFLAHEAQAVVPEAVTGTHNEVDDDGNAVMQGIDQSKLVPLLTGALQEAIAKIETLETQRADLEARLTALENA